MSDAADAIATLERSLKFSQGMHDALSGKFAKAITDLRDAKAEARAATETRDVTLMELSEAAAEIRSLSANLEEATRRYNEVVLAGLAKDAEIGRLRAALKSTKDRIDMRMNDHLCEMKPDYDDSIVGFNEAWTIVRDTFAEAIAAALSPPQPAQET